MSFYINRGVRSQNRTKLRSDENCCSLSEIQFNIIYQRPGTYTLQVLLNFCFSEFGGIDGELDLGIINVQAIMKVEDGKGQIINANGKKIWSAEYVI